MKRIIALSVALTIVLSGCGSAIEASGREKALDATTMANIRTALADASVDYLDDGKTDPDGYVIEVAGKQSNGLDLSEINLTCDDEDLIAKLDNKEVAGNVTVDFTFDENDNCTMTEHK